MHVLFITTYLYYKAQKTIIIYEYSEQLFEMFIYFFNRLQQLYRIHPKENYK